MDDIWSNAEFGDVGGPDYLHGTNDAMAWVKGDFEMPIEAHSNYWRGVQDILKYLLSSGF